MATVATATGAFSLPSVLPSSYLPSSPEQVFLLRVVLLLAAGLIGVMTVLCIVVRALNKQATRHAALAAAKTEGTARGHSEPAEEPLTERHVQVLKALFESPRTLAEISTLTEVSPGEAKFYVSDLLERQMVYPPAAYSTGPEKWCIALEGQRLVMRRGAALTSIELTSSGRLRPPPAAAHVKR